MRKNLALFVTTILISLLLVESILRIFFPQSTMSEIYRTSPRIFRKSELLPGTLKPNARSKFNTKEFKTEISINSLGYRGKEFSPRKGNQQRILIIGDSFTFGHGVNDHETYAAQLERILDGKVEVINGGYVSCYHPATYYLYLKQFGLHLEPDIVLVGFFIGNDIDSPCFDSLRWVKKDENNLPLRIEDIYSKVENGYWVSRKKQYRYRIPWLRESHLFQLIMEIAGPFLTPPDNDDIEWNSRRKLDDYGNVFRQKLPERTHRLVQQTKDLFLAMNRIALQQSSVLIPVIIPELMQIDRSTAPPFIRRPEELDLEKPQRIFTEFFHENGIPYIDLLPAMRHSHEKALYFRGDRHWTPAGHQLAAELIAEYLRKEGMLETRTTNRQKE